MKLFDSGIIFSGLKVPFEYLTGLDGGESERVVKEGTTHPFVGRRGAVVKGVEHISTILLVNI